MQETLTLTPGRAQWQEGMSLTKDTKAPRGWVGIFLWSESRLLENFPCPRVPQSWAAGAKLPVVPGQRQEFGSALPRKPRDFSFMGPW